jgi:phosphoglycerol transferase MdoB-like AlkP superfamily enzyme
VFDRAFANGKHSIDALSSIALGLPALMEDSYISSPYLPNDVRGLGTLLKPMGYSTYFFHGGERGTLGFDRFSSKAGFDAHFDMEDYGDRSDFDGNWGIYDEPFLQYTADKLTETAQPFCAVFFSLSSHHPFTIPEKHRRAFARTSVEMEAPVRYSDYALAQFFDSARLQPWFSNTVFIITADHTGVIYDEDYNNHVGCYAIPIAIYDARQPIAGHRHEVVQQTDILPTILQLSGYEGSYMAFGSSLLDTSGFKYCVNQMNDIAQIISGDLVLTMSRDGVIGLYDFVRDPQLRINLKSRGLPSEERLTRKLKAIRQQFHHALIHNAMIPPS